MNSEAARHSSKSTDEPDKEPAYWWVLPKEKILNTLKVDPENGLVTECIQETGRSKNQNQSCRTKT
jgi:hypothetical protein